MDTFDIPAMGGIAFEIPLSEMRDHFWTMASNLPMEFPDQDVSDAVEVLAGYATTIADLIAIPVTAER